ncbi:hypothetical protein DFH08DRAFT_827912 [Mycena albidolilacea]|uniref:Uncharacterized protein n=1 Tax=Mycena albidolilacea TaxID=1033008 RepID=A0AAD6YXM7_9AGAR|nr:hypothetical protein DFH08DRAFT_827912 [Mycena albidolilacea]
MSVVFAIALFLLTFVEASLLPQRSVVLLLDVRGVFLSSLAGPKLSDYGRLVCDPATDAISVSRNTTQVPFDDDPTLPEESRSVRIIFRADTKTYADGEEFYNLFCDPTLSQPKVVVVPNPSKHSIHHRAISKQPAADTLYRFSLEFIGAQRNVPYGTVERMYSFCTNVRGATYCFTIQDDGSMFVMTMEPFPALPDVATSEQLNQRVDKEEIKGQGALNGAGPGAGRIGSGVEEVPYRRRPAVDRKVSQGIIIQFRVSEELTSPLEKWLGDWRPQSSANRRLIGSEKREHQSHESHGSNRNNRGVVEIEGKRPGSWLAMTEAAAFRAVTTSNRKSCRARKAEEGVTLHQAST